jgi:hypothetical protein
MSPTTLKTFNFVTLPTQDTNPVMMRRREIITRLEHQKKLAADPNYVRTIKTKDGTKTQKIVPMWRMMEDGSYAFFLRVGFNALEWAPDKTGIAVPSLDKLPETIDAIIAAVRAGDLDAKLAPAKKPSAPGKKGK